MTIMRAPQPRMRLAATLLAAGLAMGAHALAQDPAPPAADSMAYQDNRPKTILALQPFSQSQTVLIRTTGGAEGIATLINLNPHVNAWYLLSLTIDSDQQYYHLEDPLTRPEHWLLKSADDGSTLYLQAGNERCELWSNVSNALDLARRSGLPYAPLCGARLYLRNNSSGSYTQIERVTQFLRDHVWGGDEIVNLVKDEAFRDAYAERAIEAAATARPTPSLQRPIDALVSADESLRSVFPEHLGIDLGDAPRALMLGCWYPVSDLPGTFFSVMHPAAVPSSILNGDRGRVNALDAVESADLDYLVAFDLTQFVPHFALGTDHPRLGWSERALPEQQNPHLPGPDGIASAAPLARTGMVSPALSTQVVASFAGGFKREHGAFHYGNLAQVNAGTHYGFMEQGVIFSKLQPGLATFYRDTNGGVDLTTWSSADEALLDHLVDARQNGVPLIEYDPVTGRSAPGALVNQWGAGNWSGSNEKQLRTVRAGLCLQVANERRYLVFGYFSTATPSAMARVFQAYGCRYAMQLDINALEHTYLALYVHRNARLEVEHLIDGMAEVDRKGGERLSPRFLGFPDDRDFFYLVRKGPNP